MLTFSEIHTIRTGEINTEMPTSNYDAYALLLGLEEFPESPDHLPENFTLPATLGEIIVDQGNYGQKENMENLWYINWDFQQGGYKLEQTFDGEHDTVSDASYFYQMYRKVFRTPPALICAHNHPEDDSVPSDDDYADIIRFPRNALINMTTSEYGLHAVLATRKAYQLKLSVQDKGQLAYDELVKLKKTKHKLKLLNDWGYAMYRFKARDKITVSMDPKLSRGKAKFKKLT